MGLFVKLAKPTAPMKKEAASAGVLDTRFGKFTRLQILTIEDLFAGKKPAIPPEDPAAFKKAVREENKTRQGKPGHVRETVPPPRPYMNRRSFSMPVYSSATNSP